MYRQYDILTAEDTEFEWDVAKNWRNILKHGFDFNDADEFFESPAIARPDNRADYAEKRWIALGTLQGVVASVVYTRRKECIRIISIRRASKRERKVYYEEILAKNQEPDRLGAHPGDEG